MARGGKAARASGPDLAIVFGSAKGGKKPPAADAEDEMGMGDEDMGEEPELPADFDMAASEAFPDMDADQKAALKRAIEACVSARESGEYE